ncbi:MAG: 4'-phosphopantetheinyl transferase superfamily protein [Chloroflexota bacterium]|nr:4'-phosphopantetheinyl transferase superfamily protein [Chloroflexota bacterium]
MTDPARSWLPAPAPLLLSSREVHVWRATLDVPPERVASLAQLLADDERRRADRFRFEHLRRRYIAGRATLRTILARYLQTGAEQLRFAYDEHGKPALASPVVAHPSTAIEFNVSHAEALALYAVARGRRVGIDVERVRPVEEAAGIVAQNFSAAERDALGRLPAAQGLAGFFACWTRKEAFIKAHGGGLTIPLSSFDVSVDPLYASPDAAQRLLASRIAPRDGERWRLCDLSPGEGYRAALAVEQKDTEGRGTKGRDIEEKNWELRCWEYPGVPAAG